MAGCSVCSLLFLGLAPVLAGSIEASIRRAACCYLEEKCQYAGCPDGIRFIAAGKNFNLTSTDSGSVDDATYHVQPLFGNQTSFDCNCFDYTHGWECDDPARETGKPDYGLECPQATRLTTLAEKSEPSAGTVRATWDPAVDAALKRAACCYLEDKCEYAGCKDGTHFIAAGQHFNLTSTDSGSTDDATYHVHPLFGNKSSFDCNCFDYVHGWECDDPARESGKPDYGLECPKATKYEVSAKTRRPAIGSDHTTVDHAVEATVKRAACCYLQDKCQYAGCADGIRFFAVGKNFNLTSTDSGSVDDATYHVQPLFDNKSSFDCNCFDYVGGWQCDDPAREVGKPDYGLECPQVKQSILAKKQDSSEVTIVI